MDPFPAFGELSRYELYPKNAAFKVAKDGSILVDGKPRYLTATIFYEGLDKETECPTVGYKPELNWLYRNLPDYEMAQRLGLDALGFYTPLDWMKLYRDGFMPWGQVKDQIARVMSAGFPMYIDYTASEWSHGSLFPDDGCWPAEDPGTGKRGPHFKAVLHKPGSDAPIPREAWTQGRHHWVPYSLVHPEGRAIWYTLWKEGARSAIGMGAKPWCYELLNEPAYWEENEKTKPYFESRMKKAGKLALVRSDKTAYNVEYLKFMEDVFAETLAGGRAAIKEVDPNPEARFCFQPVTIRKPGIDLWKANKVLNAVCAHTGARGIAECAILRGLADGKPIVDSEMYVGTTTNSIRSAFLQQFMRGINVSYLFKWSRRPNDFAVNRKVADENGRDQWIPDVAESIARAKRMAAYNVMNPYKVPTDQLLGIRMAKRDALDLQEFFAPRDRGVERPVAVLFSSPTERLAHASGHVNFKFFDAAVTGMEFSHVPEDVLFEEDLDRKLDGYKVLLLAGVDAVYDDTPAKIERFVKGGGTLVMYGHAMELDEYARPANRAFPGLVPSEKKATSDLGHISFEGRKIPVTAYLESVAAGAGWKPLAKIDGRDTVFVRPFGKGVMYFIGGKMPASGIGAFVAAVAKKHHGIEPVCSVKPLEGDGECDSMEVVKAVRGGMAAYMLLPHGVRGAMRFFPAHADAAGERWHCIRIRNRPDRAEREILERGKDGSYILLLDDDGPVCLVFGSKERLIRRYGRTSKDVHLFKTKWASAKKEALRRSEAAAKSKATSRDFFSVDESRVKHLELGPFANRRFMEDMPWGVVNCNGVPMNFIRYDQNDFKDCIVLSGGKKTGKVSDAVTGIPVETKAGALYFLHAVAWVKEARDSTAFKYVVRYGDGTVLDIPVSDGKNVSDWRAVSDAGDLRKQNCVRGWADARNRGFYLWKWINPHPDKYVSSLNIVSADPKRMALVAAVTVEKPAAPCIAVAFEGKGVRAFSTSKGVKSALANGVWSVALDETAESWATGVAEFPAIEVAGRTFDRIALKMNKAPDQWGKYFENPTPKIALICRDADGKWFYTNYVTPKFANGANAYRADDDPESWQEVYLPANRIDLRRAKVVYGFLLQYEMMPSAERSGLCFKDACFMLKDTVP